MLLRNIQKEGDRYLVQMSYDKDFIERMKASIPWRERHWTDKGVWSFSEKGLSMLKNLPGVHTYEERLNENIEVAYNLPEPYQGVDSSIDFEKFRRPATELLPELYPYNFQKEGISRIVNMPAQGLYFACGLGKTYTSICAAKELIDRGIIKQCLIVSIVSIAIKSWTDTLDRMGYTYEVISGPKKFRPTYLKFSEADFIITLITSCDDSKQTIYKSLDDVKNVGRKNVLAHKKKAKKSFVDIALEKEKLMVIADELHKLSNVASSQFKSLLKIRKHCVRGTGLTGTVIKSTPDKCLLPLRFEYPEEFSRKWEFDRTFLVQEQGRFGLETIGYRNLDKLKEILHKAGMPALKKDYLKDLPSLLPPKIVRCETDACSLELVDLIRNQELLGDFQGLDYTKVKDLYIRTHQALVCPSLFSKEVRAVNRLEAVKDTLESLDGKTVIFTTLKPAILELHRYLTENGIGCTCCSGDQSQEEIDRRVSKFVNDENCDVLIATIQKMGTGFDDIKIAQNVIIYDFNTNAADLIQAIGRLHRNGQKNIVSQIYILQDNAVSEYQYNKVMKQKELMESVEDCSSFTDDKLDLRKILSLVKDSKNFLRKKET